MKQFLFVLLLLFGLGVYGQNFKKIEAKDVNLKQVEFCKKFANEYFSKQLSGGYVFDKNVATEEIINALSSDKQKEVYNQIKSAFGEFKSLEYSQTWIDSNSNLILYRLKSLFGEANNLDIRVILNDKGLIAGFFVSPWTENLE